MNPTAIEWCDQTWNPVSGCSKVSQGCKNCYAERVFPRAYPERAFTDVRCHEDRLDQPLRMRKPKRIFVNSMSDLFHEDVPFNFIDDVFMVMRQAPQHIFQVLTKRPERMREYLSPDNPRYTARRVFDLTRGGVGKFDPDMHWPLRNVWLGVSVEDQATADERIPLLLQTPAAVRFVSAEPLLSRVDLSKWMHDGRRESVSCTSCSRPVQGGEGRDHLASSAMDRRGDRLGDQLHSQEACGDERAQEGQLSEDNVQGRCRAASSSRSPHRLDGYEPKTDTIWDGDQPYRRGPDEQPPEQFGTSDAPAERSARSHISRAEEEGSARREKFSGGRDRISGDRDQGDMGFSLIEPERDRREIRRNPINDIGDCPSEKLGSHSIDWVIVGGESGPGARPFDVQWARSVIAQCKAASVPVFVKQLGARPVDGGVADIVCNGKVHYSRPLSDPLIAEARARPGYSVRPHDMRRAVGQQTAPLSRRPDVPLRSG